MRKSSTYANKRRTGIVFHPAAAMETLERCRPFTVEPLVCVSGTPMIDAVRIAIDAVWAAYNRLRLGQSPANDDDDFKIMAHAIGVACIRAWQIAGDTSDMLPPLYAAEAANKRIRTRYLKWHKWDLLPLDATALFYGLEVYETIVLASSPAQMKDVCRIRNAWLDKQQTINEHEEMTA